LYGVLNFLDKYLECKGVENVARRVFNVNYRSLSGERFLLRETLKVVKLILSGKNWNEIRRDIENENIFGYRSKHSINRVLTAIKARLKQADWELLKLMLNDPYPEVINLYLMIKSNSLLMDFMKNVVLEKYILGKKYLIDREIERFLKSFEYTSGWSITTLKRSGREIRNILKKAGIIDDEMKIYRPILSDEFREYILRKEGKEFLKLFGEGT